MIRAAVRELADASGLELARQIDALGHDLHRLSDAERLEVVKATARLDAWTASIRAGAILAVHDSARDDIAATTAELVAHQSRPTTAGPSHAYDDERLLHRRVGMEVALVLGISTVAADREVDFALGLREHPQVRQALAEGRIDRTQAAVVLDGVEALQSATNQARVLTALLGPDDSPDGDDVDAQDCSGLDPFADTHREPVRELRRPDRSVWSLAPGRLRQIVRREVGELEPEALQEKARRAASQRRVVFDPQPDFMTELHLRSTTPAATAAYRNLDRTARAAQAKGDTRSLDQLRSDIAIGWLTEGAFGTYVSRPAGAARPAGEVRDPGATTLCLPRSTEPLTHLTMAMTTLLGLDNSPATLHGPAGPIPMPAEVARQLAGREGGRWKRLLYDPSTGIATDLSHSYRPSPQMAAFVRARDGQLSRLPISCASHLELDHVEEFDHGDPAAGGPTRPSNLASAGAREHHLKTDRVIDVTGDANGPLTITTPSGRDYVSDPAPCADPWGEPPF